MKFSPRLMPPLEEGFSLIEVIVSLLIVSVALAALAPALALAAYRRVLSERIEIGSQLAQGEIDRVRALVDQCTQAGCPFLKDDLPPDGADFFQPYSGISAPPSIPAVLNVPTTLGGSDVTLVESVGSGLTSGSQDEYVLQTYRNTGAPCVDDRNNIIYDANGDILPCSFEMGVRVYHRRSFDGSGVAYAGMDSYREPVTAFASFATEGARLRPVAVVEASISQAATLGDLCRALATNPATECDSFPSPIP